MPTARISTPTSESSPVEVLIAAVLLLIGPPTKDLEEHPADGQHSNPSRKALMRGSCIHPPNRLAFSVSVDGRCGPRRLHAGTPTHASRE